MQGESGLYQKHRPKRLKDFVGQSAAVDVLKGFIENNNVPHALLLTGPSGVGKTSAARFLKDHLKCQDLDFHEMDVATIRGIENIREIHNRRQYGSLGGGKSRIWLLDEAHQLTKDAQNALLKILEDNMKHVYLMLATTDPTKIIKTVITRCTVIEFKSIGRVDMLKLLSTVCKKEGKKVSQEVKDKIVEVSDGSARHALVNLEKVLAIKGSKQKRLNAIEPIGSVAEAMDIITALMPFKGKPQWLDVASAIKRTTEQPERLRQIILSCAANDVLKGGQRSHRAAVIIQSFRDNFFDSGRAGLVAAAWEVFHTK